MRPGVWRASVADRDFTRVRNDFLRSKIKPGAKALALYLMTHKSGYVISQARIRKDIGMSETAISNALEQLEQERYLVRKVLYGPRRGALGTVYLISDRPLSEAEAASELMAIEEMSIEKGVHKKTSSSKKINTEEKITKNPPGGDAPRRDASTIVSAYVDSFREGAGGEDPVKSSIRRVGAEAKRLLVEGRDYELVERCAVELGKTPYANLESQVMRALAPARSPARGMTGTRYNPAHWDAQEAEERDENGHTAEDRYLIEHYGATVTYGHQK